MNRSDGGWTLGGLQFWADVHLFRDWRIQQNVMTGRFRLLDGSNRRQASGTLDECRQRLDEIRSARKLEPLGGKAVLLLPGIVRTRHAMRPLARHLESAGYVVYSIGYPSTRLPIEEHAENLHRIVAGLPDAQEIHFVAHSMGGLVVRAYRARHHDARLRRLVMLGTPNQGAVRADAWRENGLYRLVMGPAGQQLGTDPEGIYSSLPPTLDLEFGIIAGGTPDGQGYNPRIAGNDDGTVSVASTQLADARDFALVHCRHTFLMDSDEVHRLTERFLTHGRFRSEDGR